jgi:hypothetical protein
MKKLSTAEVSERIQSLTYYRAGYTTPYIAKHRHLWRIDEIVHGIKHYRCAICGMDK